MKAITRFLAVTLAVTCIVSFCACKGDGTEDLTNSKVSQAPVEASGVIINEYCSKNTAVIYDGDGDYCDWVELYNTSGKPFTLFGYFLSDDETNKKKWAFPENTVIEPDAYLLVFLSGKDRVSENGELHASFKLGGDDKILALYSGKGKAADIVEITKLKENTSYGRSLDASGFFYFAKPTPGAANSTTGFEKLSMEIPIADREVYISEVSAAYETGNRDKTLYDWIELYNNTDKPVSLKGYGLCKSLAGTVHIFSSLSIPARTYATVYASGKETANKKKSDIYAPFTVDSSGEDLYLLRPDGTIVDTFSTGKLRIGVTSGRSGGDMRFFYSQPTPGKANSAQKYTAYAAAPVFSPDSATASAGDSVALSTKTKGAQIRFTTDGSDPKPNSQLYTAPITLNKTVTVRAAAFSDGLLRSDIASATYIIGREHTLPVVCISSDPDGLFGYKNGILANGPGYKAGEFPYVGANFWKDWEREACVEYFVNGKKELEFTAGIMVFGQYSRAYDQKSLSIHLRDSYGTNEITYPFFKGNPITTVSDLVLRAGGQDQSKTKIRDAFCREVIEGHTHNASMDFQPVALYINGQYWGYYDLREKINESYFETHENINKDAVDIVKGDSIELSGTIGRYMDMIRYMKSHDITKPDVYNYVTTQMDVDNYIDFLITEIFFCNTDTGNIKFYRGYDNGDKFKWVIFDMDSTLSSASINGGYNSMWGLFNPEGHGSGYNFSTYLQRTLLKNDTFRQKFINRYAELLNTAFLTDRMTSVLDGILSEIDPEIKNASTKWTDDKYGDWKTESAFLRSIVSKRREKAVQEFRKFFQFSDEQMSELFPEG